MRTSDCDVAVVGAGPTGLTLAFVVARAGVPVSVYDAAPGPERESSRATTIHAGTLEALDNFDGLGEEIAQRGAWARESRIWSGDRRIATVHWGRMPTRYAALINLPQADLEAILRRRLESQGVSVQWNRSVTGAEELDATYIIGCDGAHSAIRKSVGIDLVGTTFEGRFLLADVKLSGDIDTRSTNIWVSTAGVLAIMPVPNGMMRLNGTLTGDEPLTAETLLDSMRRRMGVAYRRVTGLEVSSASEYRTHSRLATAYRRGQVFLAGDAAHLNSPVGGQGMNVGIGDAIDLGSRLVRMHQGVPPQILDDYEATRRPVAKRVIKSTRQGTAMLTARSPVGRFVRNGVMRLAHRLPPFQRRLSTDAAFIAASGLELWSRTPIGSE